MIQISNWMPSNVEMGSDKNGLQLEEFLHSILSFHQLGYKEKHEIVEAVHGMNVEFKYVHYFRVHVIDIPVRYWQRMVLPGLINYAKKWKCKLHIRVQDDSPIVIRYFLKEPYALTVESRYDYGMRNEPRGDTRLGGRG